MTQPERMWAPTSEPFSSRQMFASGSFSFSRIAQASPAGPPPTMAKSYSMTSRSMSPGCALIGNSSWCTAEPFILPERGGYLGCMRMAPSRRIVSAFSMLLVQM